MSGSFRVDFESLRTQIVAFRDERDWAQFHSVRNLAAALSIEAAELQEVILWKSDQEIETYLSTRKGRQSFENELADVLIYAILISDALHVSPGEIITQKLDKNRKNYPVDKSRGNATKYTELKDRHDR